MPSKTKTTKAVKVTKAKTAAKVTHGIVTLADGSTAGSDAAMGTLANVPAEGVADESVEHVKEFVLGPGDYSERSGYSHDANKLAVQHDAIARGFHPVGDVTHVSTKTHADGKSKVLRYSVTAVPARLATTKTGAE